MARRTGGARGALRAQRRAAVLERALAVVSTEGHDALTMQRMADELECGIASVYRLFPSKDALIAELLLRALDTVHASWRRGFEHVAERAVKDRLAPGDAALARAVAAAWFWVVADDAHPSQIDLARRLFVDRRIVVPTEQAARVLPAALAMLNDGRTAIDEAVEAGVLEPGNGIERGITLIASLTGVVLTAKFDRWDQSLFDGRHLAAVSLRDTFRGWGAAREPLDRALELARELGAAGLLAPPVELAPPP